MLQTLVATLGAALGAVLAAVLALYGAKEVICALCWDVHALCTGG